MTVRILVGDVRAQLAALADESVHCVVTSPPYYGLRCYGVDGQIGLEATPEEHIAVMVDVFRGVRRVLRRDGVCWLNYGDAYATQGGNGTQGKTGQRASRTFTAEIAANKGVGGVFKPKDLLMMPARVALALQADGWWLRSMMPWVKRSAMPESATDRPASAIEYVFLLTRSARYFFDMEAVRQAQADTVHTRSRYKYAASGGEKHSANQDTNREADTFAQHFGNGSRNFRNSDLFYQSLDAPHGLITAEDPLALDVNPAGFAEAHFATFPPKLIEPLIKAGTSEKGCCARCAAPWVREVDVTYTKNRSGVTGRKDESGSDNWDGSGTPNLNKQTKTLGWSPSCACGAECVPCTILDPFGGSGTTGLVADRLGRGCILIELNPGYADMARKRIEGDAGLFARVDAAPLRQGFGGSEE